MTTAPIFIVGANRSGTTLLRLMLNAHSRIGIPEELGYFKMAAQRTAIDTWNDPQFNEREYESFVDDFLDNALELTESALNRVALRRKILQSRPSLRTPYIEFLESWSNAHGKVRWGEKTPGNLFYVDIILEMFPDARFVYMVRDPRAGVASMQGVWFYTKDVVYNALSRKTFARYGRSLLQSVVPEKQRLTLRYEDLVREPEDTLRSLCTFLGERYEPTMLNFHAQSEQYMGNRAANSFNEKATRPVSTDRIDAWRDQLSTTDIAVTETICAREMEEFGYATTGYSLPLSVRLEIWVKALYWQVQSWRNRDVRGYMVRYPVLNGLRSRFSSIVQKGVSLFF